MNVRALQAILLAGAILFLAATGVRAEKVIVPGAGATDLHAHFELPEGPGPHPALVFLHGCGGLGRDGGVSSTYRAWARHMTAHGYAVLMIDSPGSRGMGRTCGRVPGRKIMLRERPGDAYAGLRFLQAREDITRDRIGLIGWSQGGGVALLTLSRQSIGRPTPPPAHDFKAAVAFYPGACSDRLQSKPFTKVEPGSWSTVAPLLILQGGADNWTLPAPCKTFVELARRRGEPVEIVIYDGATHSFDAPNMALRRRKGALTASGQLPLQGTDPDAREDAMRRVPAFFDAYLKE
ncbi:prolyl oligopeptidase family serine peptidase [Nisaea acidiphila]|uniref:Prolyl oligopeptidase family serine peptidase n=1 Tax=Nisaea acidiphila TaxID=1862145 RepID=A0A9J7ASW9_9PROT|nr:prolyl oligopeptidase family serine peptidase [Nisaea acidiphila]UUX49428.1 prolyl oligopeptidase family serine peptidase [Nisaea acidiphila]